ncbi:MAG: GMC family oxidoreductase [Proteobacteria bacterium]|jgi:choline dehydrogenase-like flavoprotein|nr:GMC family oxidoreductase [Pseudomonadota bacterium]
MALASNAPVDVLIIGAGASGAAVAYSLADTRMRIVCMEQGDWTRPSEYPSNYPDWEQQQGGEHSIDPNVRGRPADYPINNDASPISVVNYNGVGGGTILYAAHFPRLHPSDFRVKSLDGVADDWPVSYELLEPFFAANDRMMGVSGLAGDPTYPAKQPPLPPLPLGRTGETVARGFNKLGWHWWPSDSAIISRPYEGRDQCKNLGPCTSGCAQGAKSSTDITYWPAALRAGVELWTNCRVREITVSDDGMASGVYYYDADGNEQFQGAEVVVMACNGVGTPRILLNSTSSQFPDGLANRSGLVGRNLMFHPIGFVQGLFEERLDSHMGPQGCNFLSNEFYETDLSRGFVRGYMMQVTRGGGGPFATAMQGAATGAIPWGPGHHDAFQARFDHTASIGILCEDLPEQHNTVTLDPELVDSDGIAAPKINYTLSDNSRRMIDHGVARATEVMEAAGAIEITGGGPARLAGWHLLGTARMGNDPATSVVNGWGRSHDVKNLFIVDGSIFVTSGGVNPTSTIQALALYIADTMKKNLANLFD